MPPEPPAPAEPANSNRLMVIMFSDLVNSTGLKEKIGRDEYRRLKTRHDELIQQALAVTTSGRVLQDNGDGYFLSFYSIADSVAMALVFQRLMAREPWPVAFQSRVGLHLGEVAEGLNQVTNQAGFTSSAIDLASRTMSLALGGQILMTQPVYEAARQVVRTHPAVSGEATVPSLKWLSHGPYLFKGAPSPLEVFEVGAEGTAPLRAPADSEKAKKFRPPLLTRRAGLVTALLMIFLGAVIWGLQQRENPEVQLRRQVIERQVHDLKAQPPQLRATNSVAAREVSVVEPPDISAFEVQGDSRVIDLRGWQEVPAEKVSEHFCGVTMQRQLRLKKIAAADRFEMLAQTMGLDLCWNSNDDFPFLLESQIGNGMVGGQPMKVRKLSVDVSHIKIGSEFELDNTITYWNPLQSEADQWFGVVGYHRAFAVSMLLLFPDAKPIKSYTLSVAAEGKEMPVPFAGSRIVLQGKSKDWIYWEIPEPKAGYVYRLSWTW